MGGRSQPISPLAYFAVGFGLMGAAASFLLLGQIESTTPEKTAWYALAVGLLSLGAVAVVAGICAGVRQWLEGRLSPLEIVHDPNDPQCVQDRLQQPEADLELRIKVRNKGRFDLNRVRARLDAEDGYAHWLRIRHDNTAPFQRSLEGEKLPADGSYWIYFDVACSEARANVVGRAMNIGGQATGPCVVWEYADVYLRTKSQLEPGRRTWGLTIKVWGSRESDGKSVVPAERRFVLEMVDGGPNARLLDAQ